MGHLELLLSVHTTLEQLSSQDQSLNEYMQRNLEMDTSAFCNQDVTTFLGVLGPSSILLKLLCISKAKKLVQRLTKKFHLISTYLKGGKTSEPLGMTILIPWRFCDISSSSWNHSTEGGGLPEATHSSLAPVELEKLISLPG